MATSDRVDRRPVSGETTVTVHPLVLLSVVDHYNRACKNTKNRAVGILLGSWKTPTNLDIANSFAVPFDEDEKSSDVWFLDHDYLSNMFAMFRKVNARERIVGWYHTGPKLHSNDIQINELIRRFVPHPILVIVDAVPKEVGLPTKAYVSVEEIHDDGTPTTRTFEHVASEIGAEEAEEVGVEHLLRDITDVGQASTLTAKLQNQLASLKGLHAHLAEVEEYLSLVSSGRLPLNHAILSSLQDVFNLLPNLSLESFAQAFSLKTSDRLLVVYVAAVVRATIALHNLINNKLENREAELQQEGGKKESKSEDDKKDKDGDKKDKDGDKKDKDAEKKQ